MKKLIFLIILLLIPISIKAVDIGGDYGGGGNIGDLAEGGNGTIWPYPYVAGIRVSFVNANGVSIGRNKSYIHDSDMDKLASSDSDILAYYLNASCGNKVSYITGNCSPAPNSIGSWGGPIKVTSNFERLQNLQNVFALNGFNVNVMNAVATWNYTGLFDPIMKESNVGKQDYSSRLENTIEQLFGSSLSGYYTDGKLNIFMIVEPLSIMKYDGKLYIGTEFELAKLGKTIKGGGFTSACSGSDALCDVRKVVRKLLPCTSYLDGGLADKLSGTPFAANFTNSKYFGSSGLNINNSKYRSTCNNVNSYFSSDEVVSNEGIGIGIVWLGELIEDKLSCDTVTNGSTNKYLNSTIKNAYESGSLDSFYNNKIPYYDENKKLNYADAKWYVNECTCYGMYDYFDKSYMPVWKNSFIAHINALGASNILGPDWYERLNNVKMTNLTRNRIKSVLYDYNQQNKYNSQMVTYVNTINKESKDKTQYGWTTVNEKKYYDSLKCGGTSYDTSCSILEDWYNANKPSSYKNILDLSKEDIEGKYQWEVSNMLKAYNIIYANATGKYWSISETSGANMSYIKQCKDGITKPEEPPKIYNCTPKYGVGDCINGDNINYLDSSDGSISKEYWDNCVFSDNGYYDINPHKTSSLGTLSYYEPNLGSSTYCPVYCIESLSANFDKGNFEVKAGMHFTWGSSVISGSRTCKAKEIKWDQFTTDLKDWNINIEKSYNTYLVAKDQQASVTSSPTTCCSYERECKPDDDNCDPCGDPYTGTRYEWGSASYGSGATLAKGSAGSSECSGAPDFGVSEKYNYYNGIKDNSKITYNAMYSCHVWDASIIYKLNPQANISYSDGTYNYLNKPMVQSNERYTLSDVSSCLQTKVNVLTSCSGSSCSKEDLNIDKCSNVEMTRNGEVTLKVEDGVFRYVLKSNNYSFHASELGSFNNGAFTTNYLDIGYSNFPVAYVTPDGEYGACNNCSGKLSINYWNLGHSNNSTSTAVDDILKAVNPNYNDWNCIYKVYSKLIVDNEDKDDKNNRGDINVIYRPIDLKDPFPDKEAQGRNTGSNWCYFEDCSNENKTVFNAILNNRGVSGEDVYSQNPMYTFILTPSIVREIRRYNKAEDNSYSSYTGSYQGTNYDYKCANSTGRTCISDYFSELIEMTDSKNRPGTCVEDKFRSYSDAGNFNICRY